MNNTKSKFLTVSFEKNLISIQYIDKNIEFIQRKEYSENNYEYVIDSILEGFYSKIFDFKNPEKITVNFCFGGTFFEILPLIDIQGMEKIKGSKLKEALRLKADNLLEKNKETNILSFYYKEQEEVSYLTLLSVAENKMVKYITPFEERGFELGVAEFEAETIRRSILQEENVSPDDNLAIVRTYFDGENECVAYYVYNGPFLAGVRYIQLDLYGHDEIFIELHKIIEECQIKIENFMVDSFWLLYEREEDYQEVESKFYYDNGQAIQDEFLKNRSLNIIEEFKLSDMLKKKGGKKKK